MASYQFVYHMDGVSKTYPGGKKVFENIHLNFLPGVKIGVVGVNGAGKSTLLKVMAGMDKDFQGEAWAAKGAKVGYLSQEPYLDPQLNVRGNVMEGVKHKQAKLDRYNELAMNYSDETADEMARLQDEIDAENLWDLDSQIDVAMEALRCPPDDADVAADPFAPHPSVLIAPPGHRLAGQKDIPLDGLAEERFIVREEGSGTRALMENFFRGAGFTPRIALTSSSNETIKQAVMAGLGIALISGHTVADELKAGRLVALRRHDLPILRRWFVLHRADSPPEGAALTVWRDILDRQGAFLPAA